MKKTIHIDVKEPQYMVNTNVTFAQVPGWCGHITQDLKMDIIFPREAAKPVPGIVWICGGGWLEKPPSGICGPMPPDIIWIPDEWASWENPPAVI